MMTGSQILRNRVRAGATARLDRKLAEPVPAERHLENWLHQIAGRIRLAIRRQIPVGFEDDTGFHLGVQTIGEHHRMAWERASLFVEEKSF
ncbi:MAG TPA: hypothetical protein VKS19_11420 [Verrucomicrobiae bacterium]|nr:hypothetical protein [Verrucomicrobiae bacterium]